MFLNGYPYTDFHEMNLDFLLKSINELKQSFKNFTASNSLIFADPIYHDIATSYAKNTIVIDAEGNAYIAKQNVPSGVQLDNTDYWMMVFDFEGYVERANKNFTVNYFSNVTRSDRALEEDDWLVLDDVLYKVIADIPVDGEFIIGTNIVHFTVEQFLKDFTTSITNLVIQYKDDIDASELAYQAAMQAEVDRILAGATVDSEVIDARYGANGVNYSTLGNAIRTQLTDISGAIGSIGSNEKSHLFNMNKAFCDDILDLEDEAGNIVSKIDKFGNIHTNNFNSYKTPSNDMLYDIHQFNFCIKDEDNNIVFGIKNKKSIINNKLYGKKVSIIGDSISTYDEWIPSGYATYYPHSNVNHVEETWWKEVIDYLGLDLITNASWSGSKVSGDSLGTAVCGCSDARIADLKNANNEEPEIILCYIGTNDWKTGVALGSFDSHEAIPADGTINNIADAYALMLYKIRQVYPKAIVYCMTELEGRPTATDTSYPVENSNGVTIHEVNHTIMEIAHIFGARIIDLNVCGIHYWNCGTYTFDNTHPNDKGMIAISDVVIDTLLQTYNDIK